MKKSVTGKRGFLIVLAGMMLALTPETAAYATDAGNSAVETEQPVILSESQSEADFMYRELDDGTGIKIIAYTGSATKIIIPAAIDGKKVVSIGESAFLYCSKQPTSIEIPDSVTSIEANAFYNCSSLTDINIPDSVTSIGTYAFKGCSSLKSIEIPASVVSIEDFAFSSCTNLTGITIPESLKSIGVGAFYNCSNLKSIKIPEGVESIGATAFADCSSLASINIPAGVTSIENETFADCDSLVSIEIPASVTSIGTAAFENCNKLNSIKMSTGVTDIGERAFSYCANLTSIDIPAGVTSIKFKTFCGCTSLNSAALPDSVTSIGESAFSSCTGLENINIPAGVTNIEEDAFYDCIALTGIALPDSVTSIGEYAFSGCISLKNINIPEGVTSIEAGTFFGCKSLESIEIAERVTSIGDDAFGYCGKLTIHCIENSVAHKYATDNNISFTLKVPAVLEGIATYTKTVGDAAFSLDVKQKTGDGALTYVSSNPAVVKVDASGKVTIVGAGTAEITVTAAETDKYAATAFKVTIKVKKKTVRVSSITLSEKSTELKKGKTLTLKVAVKPSDATDKELTWKSSNTKVATVNASGKVTAKKYGTATITATAKDGSGVKATCKITVPYTITYKLNKGTNNKKNPDTYYNEKVSLKRPTRKGYTFKGWYTDKKFKKKITTIKKGTKKNYTLYAKWQKVTVKATTLTSVKNNKSKQIAVKYKKSSGARGYEICYSTDKNFKKSVKKKTSTKTSYTIKNLKKGKTYYVRVRAYKLDSAGKKVYSKYTKAKKVKIKR